MKAVKRLLLLASLSSLLMGATDAFAQSKKLTIGRVGRSKCMCATSSHNRPHCEPARPARFRQLGPYRS
jgi:hypothetical protein